MTATCVQLIADVAELYSTDRRLGFSETEICSDRGVDPSESGTRSRLRKIMVPAVVFITPGSLPKRGIVGKNHASLTAGRNDLVLTEGKCGDISERTNATSLVSRAVRLGAVLDDKEGILVREIHDGIHIARPPCQVHHDNGLGSLRFHFANRIDVDILAIQVNVSEYRNGATNKHAARRGNEAPTRNNDLIARADAKGIKRQFQRDATVRHCDSVLRAAKVGKFFLELPTLFSRPVIDLTRSQNRGSYRYFFFRVVRPWAERAFARGCSTIDCQSRGG